MLKSYKEERIRFINTQLERRWSGVAGRCEYLEAFQRFRAARVAARAHATKTAKAVTISLDRRQQREGLECL
jgi:hypothetical protein